MWPDLSTLEVRSESIPSFAGSRLTFLKLGSDSAGFSGVSGIF